ncbi:MAG TPA: class I SAM-dependent methyltransferase [Actinomycetota bacterium]|nr:class I SAM-dependent methyltransferase [Actinomycetota bacterium]
MQRRRWTLVTAAGAAAALVLAMRRHVRGRRVPGGILVADARRYDTIGHRFLGSLLRGIASDVAAVALEAAEVLEVGCGPGRLSILLAKQGRDVIGLDLDPDMVERARGNAAAIPWEADDQPSFVVGNAAALPFPDGAFDLVVSTLSMHHWDDAAAGLTEIARVLRPGGRALIWDLRPGRLPLHGSVPDPAAHAEGTPLRVETSTPWRWPWRLSFLQRIELARGDERRDRQETVAT